ncbi:hypothetical protein AYO44_00685 [Planctomycetaceae bacterium SCGC AG-212-F19]|nr:hypothetical protein AYO44_00685 [Planctomycetaceae bacterium SCGC AG-212-F19]
MNEPVTKLDPAPSASRGPVLLFWLNLVLAAGLAGMVLLAPIVVGMLDAATGWQRLITLFARDATLRQTALASAIGLIVTALVFFRLPGAARPAAAKPPALPPSNVVGA